MSERPALEKSLTVATFRSHYYLKEELVTFCKANGLPSSGGKIEISNRIAHYLDTGEILQATPRRKAQSKMPARVGVGAIEGATTIEPDFVCSEKHRTFFKEKIGKGFSFNVAFQKWLKNNTGKTYAEAIEAYHHIMDEKKQGKTTIDKQFEYNTYIRAFFEDNKSRTLKDAILCWKHKKALPGHNRYEKADLSVLP